jgi:predicted kinase
MPATATLHFFCGKAGAGKSTRARALAETTGAILISEDIWLMRLYGDEMKDFEDYKRLSVRLKTIIGPLVTDLLRAGNDVVLDFPANTRATRAWFRAVFEAAGAEHILHYLESSDATCLTHIAQRNAERPEGSHHLTPEQFTAISSYFVAPSPDEGFTVRGD